MMPLSILLVSCVYALSNRYETLPVGQADHLPFEGRSYNKPLDLRTINRQTKNA